MTAAGEPEKNEESPTQLEEIIVTGDPGYFGMLDLRLKSIQESLPCFGCDGGTLSKAPLAIRFAEGLGTTLLRAFFQQPKVRGEPADEALYQSLRHANCVGDIGTSGCPDSHPNPLMVNWSGDRTENITQYEFGTSLENEALATAGESAP